MSGYDCCQKCGQQATKQGEAITYECGKDDCPQKIKREKWSEILKAIPVVRPRGLTDEFH